MMHLPSGHDTAQAYPLVLIFHGAGDSATSMVSYCGMNEVADQQQFIAVYPDGSGEPKRWNAGGCCIGDVDDVAFIKALLRDVAKTVHVNKSKVYAIGKSNGGMMANRLACDLGGEFAAIVSVAGPIEHNARPSQPIPVMHIFGSADKIIPPDGSIGKALYDPNSVEEHTNFWIEHNLAMKVPTPIEILAPGPMEVTRAVHLPKDAMGAEVVVIRIDGGGHRWPGRPAPNALVDLGKTNEDWKANKVIWEFLNKY